MPISAVLRILLKIPAIPVDTKGNQRYSGIAAFAPDSGTNAPGTAASGAGADQATSPIQAKENTAAGRPNMRRLLVLGLFAAAGLSNAGCILNQYPSDPIPRMDALMNQSEDLRQAGQDWRRFWMNDQPSHLTPYRIQGGIAPGAG